MSSQPPTHAEGYACNIPVIFPIAFPAASENSGFPNYNFEAEPGDILRWPTLEKQVKIWGGVQRSVWTTL